MLVLFIQVENVRDLDIFIKNAETKKQVGCLKRYYQKHLSRLEKCTDGDSFEEEAEVRHEIRIYPESCMFEWIERNPHPGYRLGRASYNNQQVTEVLLTLYLQKIPFICQVLA
ncbi:hypothetical protein [Cedratvirus kamchatka]|uniref:Uncharacterized protein n=1 Tax=Cedratvirus kamchatka TaxID=2716914 RepID=A0A6G8MY22_9VIRU|nr:hypothetical protein [Cedratvirus kamchatka]WIL04292.1 hypothetical protein Clen_362 [Cedratvirus lena]WIL04915.1 hypothetical protein Cduv_435 [Cedratvirus duvanny]